MAKETKPVDSPASRAKYYWSVADVPPTESHRTIAQMIAEAEQGDPRKQERGRWLRREITLRPR